MTTAILEPSKILAAHDAPVQTLAFAPDGLTMVSGDTERRLVVWDGDQRRYALDLRSRSEKVRPLERLRSVGFSRDGGILYVASGERLIALEASSGHEVWEYVPPRAWGFLIVSPYCLSVGADDRIVVSFDSGRLGVWSREGEKLDLWGDNASPRYFAHLGGGNRIVGTDRFSLCIWDLDDRSRVARIKFDERIYGFGASAQRRAFAIRTLGAVEVWSEDRIEPIQRIAITAGAPILALSPVDDEVAIAEEGGVNRYGFDGVFRGRIDVPGVSLVSLTYSPDGRILATGGSDARIRFWDIG